MKTKYVYMGDLERLSIVVKADARMTIRHEKRGRPCPGKASYRQFKTVGELTIDRPMTIELAIGLVRALTP